MRFNRKLMFHSQLNQIDLIKHEKEKKFALAIKGFKANKYIVCVCEKDERYDLWINKLQHLLEFQSNFIDSEKHSQFGLK